MKTTIAAALSIVTLLGNTLAGSEPDAPAKPRETPILKGEHMPAFSLPNEKDEMFESSDALAKGPVVVTFYRGTWCPYCRKALGTLEESVREINELGASVVAISPQTPEHAIDLREQVGMSYELLVDHDNKLATSLGLMFTLDEKTIEKYRGYGIDLSEANGVDAWQLPIPATYVIDAEGMIRYAWTDADYSKRAPVDEILAALREIQNGG